METTLSAADWALRQVEAVRDQPAKRLELLEQTYHGPWGHAPRHLPFRRAAIAFMRWTLARGVLTPLQAHRQAASDGEQSMNAYCAMAVRPLPEVVGRVALNHPQQYNYGWTLLPILAGKLGIERTTPRLLPPI